MTHNSRLEKPTEMDITKHLESLKTRLGFARFKLRNGWENNTLLDVESLWKERQRQMIDALPTPRFTQRDILDNRTLHPHYHYRTMMHTGKERPQHERRHSSHQSPQEKKQKLIRSLSTPTEPCRLECAMYQPNKPYTLDDDEEYSLSYSADRKRKRHTQTPPSPPEEPPRRIRSSLDYLSYAIAMTENQDPGELIKNSAYQDTTDSDESEYTSAPSSPATAAAEAMMMFGHHRP